jgi:5-formyltetrahydrofolate cyclo-ligase
MTEADQRSAARRLHDHVLDHVRRVQPSVIAAYVPVGREPGSRELLAELSGLSRLIVPVLLPDNDLDWAEYGSLEQARRGLLEPTGPRLGVSAVTSASLVLVPALAVDSRGNRMGRGGGSYDRALARLDPVPPPLVVALLHDGELVDAVPAEPHDRPVHGVITPSAGLIPTSEWTK